MPQTQEPHWTHITEDQHKSYVNRLGNLELLDKDLNEKAGNLAFSEKAETFAKSQIELTRRISAAPTWDLKAIEARQDELAILAVKAWPLKPR